MKDQAIIYNIGHFDCEIDVSWLEKNPGDQGRGTFKPQVNQFIFPDGKRITLLARGRLVNLGCADGHPSRSSCPRRSRTRSMARVELWANHSKYEKKVYTLPKKLDEKVASAPPRQARRQAHQAHQGAGGVPRRVVVEGPFKPEHYRY